MTKIWIRTVAAALLAIVGLAAAPLSAQTPRDTVTLGMALEPPTLDPTTGAAQAIREVTLGNIFEGLVRIDAQGRIQPGLAESWGITPDGLTYTFRLRAGVTFHNGVAFEAAHVKATFERAMAPDSTNAQKWIFQPIASIATPDPRTVAITLRQPMANFLFGLGWGDAVIFEPSTIANNRTNPVGTGPYRFVRWARGDRIELERYDGYRDRANLPIRRAVFRFMSDPQAQMAALRAGDIDGVTNFGAYEAVDLFRNDPRFRVTVGNTEGETILALNNGRPPFNDVRVRRAVAHAIDRAAIIQGAMSGFGTPIGSHFSPNHAAYVDLTGTYPHDPARARALLAEAGHPNGLQVTLRLPPPVYARRGGEIIAAQLAAVGIRATIEPVEFAQWLQQVFQRRDFDMTIISHTEPLDIDIYARETYYFSYAKPEFRALIERINATVDETQRNALYQQAQRMLAEDSVNGFLFMLPKVTITAAALQGVWANWPIPANPIAEMRWQ
ncbi:MAG: ABC transporter substrate-binding protein [Alphaproteobacteria bacterium]|nr:ABC transporter substrate-binding protein [Alphaproteobacteria bacterium]